MFTQKIILFNELPIELKTNKNVALAAFQLEKKAALKALEKRAVHHFKDLSEALRADKQVALKALEKNAVNFNDLSKAYKVACDGLLDGGVNVILIETVFDTLNAKAAIFAVKSCFSEREIELPIIISGTITDKSGRMLTGQTPEAFWNSVRHANPLAIGLNCALGAADLKAYVQELSRVADCYVSVHPNAGLPNAFGAYLHTSRRPSAAHSRAPRGSRASPRQIWLG